MKRLNHVAFISLGQILMCVFLVDLSNGARLEREHWEPLHRQLYSIHEITQLNYEQTFQLIRQLNSVYEPFTNAETNGRKQKIMDLLETSVFNSNNCHPEHMQKLQRLLSHNRFFTVNVLPFLARNVQEMRDFCINNINFIIEERIGLLNPNVRADMKRLVSMTTGPGLTPNRHLVEYWRDHTDHVKQGAANYISEKISSETPGRTGRGDFELAFTRHLKEMCDAWKFAMLPAQIIDATLLLNHLGVNQLLWLQYNKVCDLIMERRNSILRRLRNIPSFKSRVMRVLRMRRNRDYSILPPSSPNANSSNQR